MMVELDHNCGISEENIDIELLNMKCVSCWKYYPKNKLEWKAVMEGVCGISWY